MAAIEHSPKWHPRDTVARLARGDDVSMGELLAHLVGLPDVVDERDNLAAQVAALRAQVATLTQRLDALGRHPDGRQFRSRHHNTPAEMAAYERGYNTGYRSAKRKHAPD